MALPRPATRALLLRKLLLPGPAFDRLVGSDDPSMVPVSWCGPDGTGSAAVASSRLAAIGVSHAGLERARLARDLEQAGVALLRDHNAVSEALGAGPGGRVAE
jgi:hypothetical protein